MLLGWIFYLPMAIAGVPPVVFVAVGLIDLLYQFWIHTIVGKLGWFDRVFASPSNHRVHHGVNDQYLDKNYGGILIVWDRLFGTYEDEVEPPVFGVRGGLGTFDPISANLAYYRTMFDLCRRATDWRDKIRVWFEPPGWFPANLRPADAPPYDPKAVRHLRSLGKPRSVDPRPGGARRHDRRDSSVSRRRAASAARQGHWRLSPAHRGAVGEGSVLDGRISICEALYIFAAASTCAAYALDWPLAQDVMKPSAMALLIVSFVLRDGDKDMKRLILLGARGVAHRRYASAQASLFLPGLSPFSRRTASTSPLFPGALASCLRARHLRRSRLSPSSCSPLSGRVSPGPQGAGRGLCRRYRADGGAGRGARDHASRWRRRCGRRRGVDLHAVRHHDRAHEIRQYRLARGSMDIADLLSRAGSDRFLYAAARRQAQGGSR